jgi:hypothetical protein
MDDAQRAGLGIQIDVEDAGGALILPDLGRALPPRPARGADEGRELGSGEPDQRERHRRAGEPGRWDAGGDGQGGSGGRSGRRARNRGGYRRGEAPGGATAQSDEQDCGIRKMSGDAPTAPLHHRPPPERGRSGRPTGALRPVFFRQTRSAVAALFSSRSDQLDPLALCTMSRAWAAAGEAAAPVVARCSICPLMTPPRSISIWP